MKIAQNTVSNINYSARNSKNEILQKNDNQQKNKKSYIKSALGTAGAMIGSGTIQALCGIPALSSVYAMSKIKVPKDKVDLIHNASEKALELGNVKNKGVSIKYLRPSGKKLSLIEKMLLIINPLETEHAISEGLNAAFNPFENKIYLPKEKLAFSAFHEIGHSINFNNSKFWKGMQNMNGISIYLAMLPILYGSMTQKSEATDDKKLNKLQKTNNFIRDNAGKLSFAIMLPTLAEEGMASIRGQKLANKLLPKNLANTVLKGNALGYTSYLASALGLSAAAYTAVKIKDAICNKNSKQK